MRVWSTWSGPSFDPGAPGLQWLVPVRQRPLPFQVTAHVGSEPPPVQGEHSGGAGLSDGGGLPTADRQTDRQMGRQAGRQGGVLQAGSLPSPTPSPENWASFQLMDFLWKIPWRPSLSRAAVPWCILLGVLGGILPCWGVCLELHGTLPPPPEGDAAGFQMPPRSPCINGQRKQSEQ